MSKQDGSGRRVSATEVDDPAARILHVDMDAFFASVELLERPDLVGKPVIVGHHSARSVVTAATYEARKYGVNSAMPMALAMRRCPHAVVLEPHFERYAHYSRVVMDVLGTITPHVEPLSVDEAFLDVASARKLLGNSWQIGRLLRDRVYSATGLRCSAGGGATKFMAKLASGMSKPDGLLIVPAAETVAFLHPLPVAALWGVGAKTEETLRRLGLATIGDVAHAPEQMLRRALGDAGARKLHDLSWGRDPRLVAGGREEKSIGHETTFDVDVTDHERLDRVILELADAVGRRLRIAGVTARTVALKLRFDDFTTITRSRTLADPTDLGRRIAIEARELYAAANTAGRPIRLIGVRAEQLAGEVAAPGLWDDDDEWRETEQTVDAVAEKFGVGALKPASLLNPATRRRYGHGDD